MAALEPTHGEDRQEARLVRVRGTVQGVGFRPFVYRLAQRLDLAGWVRNEGDGVEVYVEGAPSKLDAFIEGLTTLAPPAAEISGIRASPAQREAHTSFAIIESAAADHPTVHISPDLPVCDACLSEMADASDRRRGYPYINCTNCGPRFSIVEALPYDRAHTTMQAWPMCAECAAEYEDPLDRRYHAQPTACPVCGPSYRLVANDGAASKPDEAELRGSEAVAAVARHLREGRICAVKGLGGYHLACDARSSAAIRALRERKYRKEKPFAVMVRDLAAARDLADISADAAALLSSSARPIVLVPARVQLDGVAPGIREIGIMLPYAPLHVLLFEAGAPDALVMTSANRSSEPIAYRDDDAIDRLGGIADYFLAGERPIARRIDDSVARVGPLGPVILRRSRGYAPSPVATFPTKRPILALGADLKNSITLVVDGQAYVSQHIGDLAHYEALCAFDETASDLLTMYKVREDELLVVHDAHPQYASTQRAKGFGGEHRSVQHHRAHIASVLAEKGALEVPAVGLALDGTGYGDDGTIWGGEVFVGSVSNGFERVAHLRQARLPGGDAAAEHPLQAAAGFLDAVQGLPDLQAPPFEFTDRYEKAHELLRKDVRTFATTSTGRLFDTAAALLGFTRPITYEGQAAIWLEQLAAQSSTLEVYPFPDLDYRPLLSALLEDVLQGITREDAARAFHFGLAEGFARVALQAAAEHGVGTVALSGGVFQNQILSHALIARLRRDGLRVWMNSAVPPNDGGISLGQAAWAACRIERKRTTS